MFEMNSLANQRDFLFQKVQFLAVLCISDLQGQRDHSVALLVFLWCSLLGPLVWQKGPPWGQTLEGSKPTF
jgi:hypothetical protein